MIKIEVQSTDIDSRSGTSARTGKPYTIRSQEMYLHTGKAYPELVKINLGDDQQAYPKGVYTLSADSFFQGKFQSIGFRPVLIPLAAAKAA